MPTLELTLEESERLLSIVRTNNHILKSSGEWLERTVDLSIEKKLFDLSVVDVETSISNIKGACQKDEM